MGEITRKLKQNAEYRIEINTINRTTNEIIYASSADFFFSCGSSWEAPLALRFLDLPLTLFSSKSAELSSSFNALEELR